MAELKFDPIFSVKRPNYSLSAQREKNESFWFKTLSYWRNKNFTQLFRSKWLNFSLSAPRKMSHFDLKSWISGGTKIWPNFQCQNDSIFHSMHREKKVSHFDLKSWVTGGTKIWPNFLGQNDSKFFSQCTERKNWVIFWP